MIYNTAFPIGTFEEYPSAISTDCPKEVRGWDCILEIGCEGEKCGLPGCHIFHMGLVDTGICDQAEIIDRDLFLRIQPRDSGIRQDNHSG